jgi:hypothetical protein
MRISPWSYFWHEALRLDHNPKTVAIVAGRPWLFQLHNDGEIWSFTGSPCSGDSCPGWQRLDHNPKTVAIVAANSALFQLHNDGEIWSFTGSPCSGDSCPGWQRLDHNPKTVAIASTTGSVDSMRAPADTLAGLNGSTIWYTADLVHWTNIPGSLTSLVVGDFNGDGRAGRAGLAGGPI